VCDWIELLLLADAVALLNSVQWCVQVGKQGMLDGSRAGEQVVPRHWQIARELIVYHRVCLLARGNVLA
jgi:hypothetical protein